MPTHYVVECDKSDATLAPYTQFEVAVAYVKSRIKLIKECQAKKGRCINLEHPLNTLTCTNNSIKVYRGMQVIEEFIINSIQVPPAPPKKRGDEPLYPYRHASAKRCERRPYVFHIEDSRQGLRAADVTTLLEAREAFRKHLKALRERLRARGHKVTTDGSSYSLAGANPPMSADVTVFKNGVAYTTLRLVVEEK